MEVTTMKETATMKRLQEIMSHHLPDFKSQDCNLQELRVKSFNEAEGDMQGYDCPICKNKGLVAVYREGEDDEAYKQCECIPIRTQMRQNLQMIKASGLDTALKEKTFDTFEEYTKAHTELAIMAKRYAKNPSGWFFLSGKSGTGKTHLCTAVVGKLLENGTPCKYMLWREEAPKLKANVNEKVYAEMVEPYKTVKCLYIDDLFKGGVTQADINLVFEILNHRYMNEDLLTIISTEKSIEAILKMDEAVGGRIYERARANGLFEITKWGNYRLRQ